MLWTKIQSQHCSETPSTSRSIPRAREHGRGAGSSWGEECRWQLATVVSLKRSPDTSTTKALSFHAHPIATSLQAYTASCLRVEEQNLFQIGKNSAKVTTPARPQRRYIGMQCPTLSTAALPPPKEMGSGAANSLTIIINFMHILCKPLVHRQDGIDLIRISIIEPFGRQLLIRGSVKHHRGWGGCRACSDLNPTGSPAGNGGQVPKNHPPRS